MSDAGTELVRVIEPVWTSDDDRTLVYPAAVAGVWSVAHQNLHVCDFDVLERAIEYASGYPLQTEPDLPDLS